MRGNHNMHRPQSMKAYFSRWRIQCSTFDVQRGPFHYCIPKEHVLHLHNVHIHTFTHKHIIIYCIATICCELLWQTKTAAPAASSGGTLWPQIFIDSYTYKCYHDLNAWMGIIAMMRHLLGKLKDRVPGVVCKERLRLTKGIQSNSIITEVQYHRCGSHRHALCNQQLQLQEYIPAFKGLSWLC